MERAAEAIRAWFEEAQGDPGLLDQAASWTDQYWQTFRRDPLQGRAYTEAGFKVILPAPVLAVDLFGALEETLGEAVAHILLYNVGKAWGRFNVEHFKAWGVQKGLQGPALRYGSLFFPMQVGLTPGFDLVQVERQGIPCAVVRVNESVFSVTRHAQGLDTAPAHWLISGWLAGCLSAELGLDLEARDVPGSGATTYHVVVAPTAQLGQLDLREEFWLRVFEGRPALVVRAGGA